MEMISDTSSAAAGNPYATARELGLMEGFPPDAQHRVHRANWFFPPYNRWAFANITSLIPTAEVSRGTGPVRALPVRAVDRASVEAIRVTGHDGNEKTLAQMLERTFSDALVVLHRGELVYESYGNDVGPETLHLIASVTKSFTGTLMLMAIEDGLVDVGARTVDYLPELKDSGFENTTVQQVLDMVLFMEWDELEWLEKRADADDGGAMFLRFLRATGTWVDEQHDPASGLWQLLPSMRQAGPPGERFQYFTPGTDVLGWILCRVHQQPYVPLLSERLWSRIGAEHAGRIALDPVGVAVASGGLNITARDLARFGQLLLDGGQRGGAQIVPSKIIKILRAGGDPAAFARAPEVSHMPGWSYRAQWWVAPGGVVTAWGVNGQILWIDFDREVVIARFASAPFSIDPEREVDEAAMCEALVEHFGS